MKLPPNQNQSFAAVAAVLFYSVITAAAEIVPAGVGSYFRGLPDGVKGPPRTIHATTEAAKGPMPTNDWWSSLAWMPLSESMFPHPLAVRAVDGGLRVWYPGSALAANEAAIMGGGGADVILGHSKVEKFSEARVAGWSDWFVTTEMGTASEGMKLTFGHGSPFVYAEYVGGEPTISLAKGAEVFAGNDSTPTIGVRVGGNIFGLFAPTGSRWEGMGTAQLTARTNGKSYFSLAIMPDQKPETLAAFTQVAHHHVSGSTVSWSYDQLNATTETTFSFQISSKEGDSALRGTLFALYPHQWRQAKAEYTGEEFQSVRGPMKLAKGTSFSSVATLPPILPGIPLTKGVEMTEINTWLAEDLKDSPQLTGDTYWLGKQLGKWATILTTAEQAGNSAAVAECDRRLRHVLEAFLKAGDKHGSPKKPGDGLFAYDPVWGTLIGYPASYGSEDQINDHHVHYGYFLRAAGELARRDPKWVQEWKPMLQLLIRDIASPDRDDPMFPFLRCFDPYAGHTWASGHAKFGDGNNNESSSEAVNAWFGILLLGEALGDKQVRDMGAWLLATEVAAIEDYWFDVQDDLHHPKFTPSVVTMVWGGKGANGTWFSANPEAVHGINFLPISGASLYLGRWPDYCGKNYTAMLAENQAFETANATKKKQPLPTGDGSDFDQWADILWCYRALSDPADARRLWKARPQGFKPEAGNSLTQTGVWIAAFDSLGLIDRSVTANTPFAATFVKDGKRTHVAWNLSSEPMTVKFSDGTIVSCPARSLGRD